jgi:hypothetical protein
MLLSLGLRLSRNEYKIVLPQTGWGFDEETMKVYPENGAEIDEWAELLSGVTPAILRMDSTGEMEGVVCKARIVLKPGDEDKTEFEDVLPVPVVNVIAKDELSSKQNAGLNPGLGGSSASFSRRKQNTPAVATPAPTQQIPEEVAAALKAIKLEARKQAKATAESQAKKVAADALRAKLSEAERIQKENPARLELARTLIVEAIRDSEVRETQRLEYERLQAEGERVRRAFLDRERARASGLGGFGGGQGPPGGWVEVIESIEGDMEMSDSGFNDARDKRDRKSKPDQRHQGSRDTSNGRQSRASRIQQDAQALRNSSSSRQERCIHCDRTNYTSQNCKRKNNSANENLRVPASRNNRNESNSTGSGGSNHTSGNNSRDNSHGGRYCSNCKMKNHNTEDCTQRAGSSNREETFNRSGRNIRDKSSNDRDNSRQGQDRQNVGTNTGGGGSRDNSWNTQNRQNNDGGGSRETSRNTQNRPKDSARSTQNNRLNRKDPKVCGNCGKTGHRTEDCRSKATVSRNTGNGDGDWQMQNGGRCGQCGQRGHGTATCPEEI